jgi:putative membrane protein
MNTLLTFFINAVAVAITAYILPGVNVAGFVNALLAAIVLSIINAFIKPIVILLTLPINIITLGLFTFVINALMILIVSTIVPGFNVDGFWWALLFSLILSVVQMVLHRVL